jgi:serine phosphatase RsbU (regulator of sigma subunit)
VKNEQDQLSYNKSARRLSELLLIKGDFEGSLQVAMPAVAKMKETNSGSDIDYAILLNNIGCCELNLGRVHEASVSFYQAREHYRNRWQNDTVGRGLQEAVIGTIYTSQAYINTRRFEDALYWIDRTEMLLNLYRKMKDSRKDYIDEYKGQIEIMRAVAKLGIDSTEQAAEAYQDFLQTNYSKTSVGRINANDYLVRAGRYSEALDNYNYLDQMLAERDIELTLDNIELYLLPKLRANVGAQRCDSVMVLSLLLCDALDSAVVKRKNDDAAELATIYNTSQKEAKINQQQADMDRQRWLSVTLALSLLILFFLIFIYFRFRSAKRLALAHKRLEDAHTKLKGAYDKLEETTAVKERIESELRIARDIQMSMVPGVFPERDDLDIYASMIPAKEVGGDLYGYLLISDKLYFCVGDVSGKGVPASLFMAQATRLFRTLATQEMMPAEISTRMNAELSGDNEAGMFVTMFIGLVDLGTGRLDFCNCGHNPPILRRGEQGVEFLDMEPNAPIGLWPGLEYVGEHIDNIKGCPLFIYTDGLNEAENRQQEQFGDDRLLDILRTAHFENARQVVECLKAEVEKHRNGADPNDDLTMLCLKVR